MTAETGLESGMVTSLGYATALRLNAIDRTVMPFAQATMLMAKPNLHDYAFRGGAQISLLQSAEFDLSAQLAFDVAETENSIYRGTALRTDLVLLGGHYGRRSFAVGELGMTGVADVHQEQDWYGTYFYSDAKDGWYRRHRRLLHAGARGGVTIGPRQRSSCAPASAGPKLQGSRPAFLRDAGCERPLLTREPSRAAVLPWSRGRDAHPSGRWVASGVASAGGAAGHARRAAGVVVGLAGGAIAVFGAVFYWWLWAPAAARAEASETRCGNWSLALGFILLLGLFVHLGVGVLFGLLARHRRSSKVS